MQKNASLFSGEADLPGRIRQPPGFSPEAGAYLRAPAGIRNRFRGI